MKKMIVNIWIILRYMLAGAAIEIGSLIDDARDWEKKNVQHPARNLREEK